MSSTSVAVKNTLVFLMLVLLTHTLLRKVVPLRDGTNDVVREVAKNPKPAPASNVQAAAPNPYAEVLLRRGPCESAGDGAENNNGAANAAAVPKELLDYVFGSASTSASPIASPKPAAPQEGAGNQKPPNAGPQKGGATDNLLISMTGGELSPGLFAFDGSDNPYSSAYGAV